MPDSVLVNYLYETLYNVAIFSLPPLVLATAVAFLIGLFQAVTQIQEQTLPQTVKIFVIGFVVLSFGASLASPLFTMSDRIFSTFPQLVR